MKYIANGWNWVHLLCGALYIYIMKDYISFNPFVMVLHVFFIDIAKEILDEVCKRRGSAWMSWIGFDPAGFDIRDVLMALIGSWIAIGLSLLSHMT